MKETKKVAAGRCSALTFTEMVAKHGTASCESKRGEPADGNFPCSDEFWDLYGIAGCEVSK